MTPIRHHTHISQSQHYVPETIHHSASILRPQIDKTAAFLGMIHIFQQPIYGYLIWRHLFIKQHKLACLLFLWLMKSLASNKPSAKGKRSNISGIPQPPAYVPMSLCNQSVTDTKDNTHILYSTYTHTCWLALAIFPWVQRLFTITLSLMTDHFHFSLQQHQSS